MSERPGGWVYRTFQWRRNAGDFEAWVQGISDAGWERSEYGPGTFVELAGERTYVLRVRRWSERPTATPRRSDA